MASVKGMVRLEAESIVNESGLVTKKDVGPN